MNENNTDQNTVENSEHILDAIELTWPHKRVLVIGDVMLDKYIWGEVERVSPEAPVPVVRASHNSEQPGGGANVAMNIAGLGARATVLGFAGADDDGQRLQESLARAGVEAALVRAPEFPTISKLRILGGNQQMLRLDIERRGTLASGAYAELMSEAVRLIPEADAIVLSDYAKGVLTEAVCRQVLDEARRHGVPVLVDPKTPDFRRYRGATTISPNLNELTVAIPGLGRDLDVLFPAAQKRLREWELEYLVVTLGEKGIAVVREESITLAPAVARQVFDVSGAGDTVIAVLALSLAAQVPIESAVRLANVAAGVVVSKVGTVPIQKAELIGALSTTVALHAEEKILSRDRLLGRITAWRAAGERIAFTNGCFDLLHVGHLAVLEQARREADRLVVGLNTDQSVGKLKGASRPVVGERERAQVLAALAAVDAVVLFGEETPLNLVAEIRPDVLVKGGDYSDDNIVGANEVRSWGGRVKIVPLLAGVSTTELIARSRS